MGRPNAVDPERDFDRMGLELAMEAAEQRAERVPCRSLPPRISSAWADEDDNRASTLAALLCSGCPVFDKCREFGLKHRSELGTYGGLSHQQRRPKRGRPSKDAAA